MTSGAGSKIKTAARRPEWLPLAGICLLALILRLGAINWASPGVTGDLNDIAWNLAGGHGFSLVPDVPTAFRAPLYPAFAAVFYRLFAAESPAQRLTQAVLTTLVCVIAYACGRRLFGRSVGLWAALAVALSPELIVYGNMWAQETVEAFLLMLGAWALLRALEASPNAPDLRWLALAGLVLGLKTLNRPITLLFPTCVSLALWLLGHHWRKTIAASVTFALAFYLTIAPWTVRNYVTFHRFIPVSADLGLALLGSESWAGALSAVPDSEIVRADGYRAITVNAVDSDTRWVNMAVRRMRERPQDYLSAFAKRVVRFWYGHPAPVPTGSHGREPGTLQAINQRRWGLVALRVGCYGLEYGILILGLAGMWIERRQWRRALSITMTILYYWALYSAVHVTPRYKAPVVPLVSIFAAAAIGRAAGVIRAWIAVPRLSVEDPALSIER